MNQQAYDLLQQHQSQFAKLNVASIRSDSGVAIYDFGVKSKGSLTAGCLLAELCMAGLSRVSASDSNSFSDLVNTDEAQTWVTVETESPVQACMGAQYAGWPIAHEKFFAMGSGPMRAVRGKEHVLKELNLIEKSDRLVGVMETDTLPNDDVLELIANECSVTSDQLHLMVAPVTSLAGTVQVVARSVETALHKMFEIGFDLTTIVSGRGIAPLPPLANDTMSGIGWTNDAILYAGSVHLVVDTDDQTIEKLGPQIPSCSSSDFGQPFAAIFEKYDRDFYKIDPLLFCPAKVTLENRRSGNQFTFGQICWDVLQSSFSS